MTVAAIPSVLGEVIRQNVQLWTDAGGLCFRAPEGALSGPLRKALAENKPELLDFLAGGYKVAPASFAQRGLWFLEQFESIGTAYSTPIALQVSGRVHRDALSSSIQRVAARHEALRTTFIDVGGEPAQLIHPSLDVPLAYLDIRELPEIERQERLRRLAREEASRPFDLAKGPLVRFTLVQTGEAAYGLFVTLHHIISDGSSLVVLVQELARYYEAFTAGREALDAPLASQYADFAQWQRRHISGQEISEQIEYWREQLKGAPPLLELPTDFPRPQAQSFAGAAHRFQVDAPLVEQLKAFSRSEHVTLFMTLLSAFNVLLHRYSRQDDIVVGSPVAGRTRPGTEQLIGFFVNVLPLRMDISGEPTFRALVARARETALGAFAHQDTPFETLVDHLRIPREPAHPPLFQAMFVLQNMALPPMRFAGLALETMAQERSTTKFDLSLSLVQFEDHLNAHIEYNSDLFREDTIARMAGHFMRLLEAAATDPDCSIARLPLLPDAEWRRIMVEWNQTAKPYSTTPLVPGCIEALALSMPDAEALADEGRRITYRELNARANQLAHHLLRLGVGPESLAAVCAPRSADLIVAYLAIFKAGGAYVPIDPAYPPGRIQTILEDARPAVVLAYEGVSVELPAGCGPLVRFGPDWSAFEGESAGNIGAALSPSNRAYVIYTSGSTGVPKGVEVEHGGLLNLVHWAIETYGLAPGERQTQFISMTFDASASEIWPTLCAGASLVIMPETLRTSLPDLIDWIARERLTIATMPSVMAEQALVAEWPPHAALRLLLTGGDKLHFGPPSSFRAHVGNNYGPTENTIVSTYLDLPPGATHGAPTIGRPIANTQAYILDAQMQPVPMGVPGELYLGGANLARGYLNRPELTAERFVPHPFSDAPGARLYRSGDVVRFLPDGQIEFTGRADFQVKIRGFRIELGEIETALQRHPDVREAAVVALEDASGGKRLVAYAVSKGAPLDVLVLRAFLESSLPTYMIPAHFVFLDAMPLMASGKIDRRALPAPDYDARESDAYEAPRNAAEERLAGIWREVLGVERVGRRDNFFELGGDSILSIQVVARANQTGLAITPKLFFQHQTVAGLAAAMGGREALPAAEQGLASGTVPLTPIQRWFFEGPGADAQTQHYWNQAPLIEIRERFESEALQKALQALVEHHDALRLRYAPSVDGWVQSYAEPSFDGLLETCDLSEWDSERLPAAIEAAASAFQATLHITRGPMFRALYMNLGAERSSRLLLAAHHLVVDGVSWRILIEDLQSAYAQVREGRAIVLPSKTASYKCWADALAEYAESETVAACAAYWLDASWKQAALLPLDFPGGGNSEASARVHLVFLNPEENRVLFQDISRAYRTQINDLLLTALADTLTAWTGSRAVSLTIEGHGRDVLPDGPDCSRTVGWFTSAYPVLLKTLPGANLGKRIKSIKEQLRHIPGHGAPYGLLRYLRKESTYRDALASTPEPDVAFNYLGQFDAPQMSLADESAGPMHDPRNRRTHAIVINAMMLNGRLGLEWSYSENLHRTETIAQWAEYYMNALRALIAHCQDPASGGCTPSDFPRSHLDVEQLDRLIARFEGVAGPRDIEDIYPLSPMQEGMLFHTLLAPSEAMYIEQWNGLLSGVLDVAAFQQAWRNACARHSILRTAFVYEGAGEPRQVVFRRAEPEFTVQDWRGVDEIEQATRLESFIEADRARGFALERAPLTRFTLLHLRDTAWRLVWTTHHLLIDGWSMPVLLRETLADYEAMRQGGAGARSAAPPYGDYIAWLESQDHAAAESYWRGVLDGFTHPTPLCADRAGAAGADAGRGNMQATLPPEMRESLNALARRHRITLNTILQGAWALVLARRSDEDDIVFGATVTSRPPEIPGIESMVGLFINTIPVRVSIPEDEPASAWLRSLHERAIESGAFDFAPLAHIQRWSGIPASKSLFDSILVFENYPMDDSLRDGMGDLRLLEHGMYERTNYPLTAVAVGQTLLLRLVYDRRYFSEAEVERVLGQWRTALEHIAANEDAPLGTIATLSEAERHRVLVEWNATERTYPDAPCPPDWVRDNAMARPEALAIEGRGRRLTYGELNARANQIAHTLRRHGVQPGDLVAVCMKRCPELPVAWLGVWKAGAAYVAIDPAYPPSRIAFMLEDSAARALLAGPECAAQFEGSGVRMFSVDPEWTAFAQEPDSELNIPIGPEDRSYVIYTSGSTGQPKGVEINHGPLRHLLQWHHETFACTPEDRSTCVSGPAFDAATYETWWALTAGGSLHVQDLNSLSSYEAVRDWILSERLTGCFLPTSIAEGILGLEWPTSVSMRFIYTGGDTLHRYPPKSFPSQFANLYGPTENTVMATGSILEPGIDGAPSIGRPMSNVRVYILDTHGRPTPIGVPGELHITGYGLARGYLNRPDLTAKAFVPDLFSNTPGARMYRTGDLVRYRSDGQIEFLGRIDTQVKVRGYRIELGEIEAVLASHPQVREAVVDARDDGRGGKQLVAYYAPEGCAPAPQDLAAHLRAALPDHMVPARYMAIERIPLTPNGKVDRRALPELDEPLAATRAYVAPRTPEEETIARVWQEVLGVERVGVHDNYFELGGHSLTAIQLLSRLKEATGMEVSIQALFSTPTVEGLAASLSGGPDAPDSAPVVEGGVLVPLRAEGGKRPFFCAAPATGVAFPYYGMALHIEPGRPFYALQDPRVGSQPVSISSIEELATHYIAAMRRVQPHGPYFLGGWSYGGVVAFEMARQLEAEGERVDSLILFDAVLKHDIMQPPRGILGRLGRIWRILHVTAAYTRDSIPYIRDGIYMMLQVLQKRMQGQGNRMAFWDFLNWALLDGVYRILRRKANVADTLSNSERLSMIDIPETRQVFSTLRANTREYNAYQPKPYGGSITLMHTAPEPAYAAIMEATACGWRDYAHGGVTQISIPGNHAAIFASPYVEVLTQRLNECLHEAEKQP